MRKKAPFCHVFSKVLFIQDSDVQGSTRANGCIKDPLDPTISSMHARSAYAVSINSNKSSVDSSRATDLVNQRVRKPEARTSTSPQGNAEFINTGLHDPVREFYPPSHHQADQ